MSVEEDRGGAPKPKRLQRRQEAEMCQSQGNEKFQMLRKDEVG